MSTATQRQVLAQGGLRHPRVQGEPVRHGDDRDNGAARRRRGGALRERRRRLRGQHLHGDRSGGRREPAAGAPGAALEPARAGRADGVLCPDQRDPGRGGGGGRLRRRHRSSRRRPARRARRARPRGGARSGSQPAQGTAGDDARRRGLSRADAGLSQGAGGLRPVLHVLHRAHGARQEPQRRAAAGARRAAAPRCAGASARWC